MNKFKQFLLHYRIWFLWAISALFTSISFLVIYYKIKPQDNPEVPVALHYNVIVGVDLYGRGRNLFLVPLTGLIILILNIVIYRLLRHRQKLLAEFVVIVTAVVTMILCASVLFLLKVN